MSYSNQQGSHHVHGEVTVDKITAPVTVAGTVSVEVGALAFASGEASSEGNNLIVTPTAGKKLRVYYASCNPAEAVQAGFRFGTDGTLFLRNNVPAKSIVGKDFGDFRYLSGSVGEALYLNLSGAVATIWNVNYLEVN